MTFLDTRAIALALVLLLIAAFLPAIPLKHNIYECIALNAIAFVDPKTAAAYMFKREQAECKGLDTGLTQGMPDLHREEHRINNRRERCSFTGTQKLIAKMMFTAVMPSARRFATMPSSPSTSIPRARSRSTALI